MRDLLDKGLNQAETAVENVMVVDLSKFTEDKRLGDGLRWIIQLKGFNRQDRLEKRNDEVASGATGSISHREISQGAIIVTDDLPMDDDILGDNDVQIRIDTPDTRGLVKDDNGDVFFGAVDKVYKLDKNDLRIKEVPLKSSWLAFIHSISISPDQTRLLVTSAGFDRIIEFDIASGQPTYTWNAWENGFDKSYATKAPINMTINSADYSSGLGLPPGLRTAFPNSSIYAGEYILATFFHHGFVKIDKTTNTAVSLDENLKHPHSVTTLSNSQIMVTDTGNGRAVVYNEEFGRSAVLDFTNLPQIESARGMEWLQQVKEVTGYPGLYTAIDSNRESIYLFDLQKKLIRKAKIQSNWVLQEMEVLF
ncbi:MAG: hypothetical protein WC851_03550 [Candidatus Shapirobacteria bacterium]|jgi:hypothetical protein